MRKKCRKKIGILIAVLAALVLSASIGTTMAYFTTYTRAVGGQKLHLGYSTTVTESFSEKAKHVVVSNDETSASAVFVRVKGFSAQALTYNSNQDPHWAATAPEGSITNGEGYWYYLLPVDPGKSTSQIDISITFPGTPKEDDSFNMIVIYESTPVKYKEDGTPYADWTTVLEVKKSSQADLLKKGGLCV